MCLRRPRCVSPHSFPWLKMFCVRLVVVIGPRPLHTARSHSADRARALGGAGRSGAPVWTGCAVAPHLGELIGRRLSRTYAAVNEN